MQTVDPVARLMDLERAMTDHRAILLASPARKVQPTLSRPLLTRRRLAR